MTGLRRVGLWTIGLAWLASTVGCADTTKENSNAKPSEVKSTVDPEDTAETVSTDQPAVDEPGTTVIPLNKIWATQIPGTQSMHLLRPDPPGHASRELSEQGSLHLQIGKAFIQRLDKNLPIGSGFAVAGSGYEALATAHKILGQDKIPSQTFPAGTEVSLFFFTDGYRLGLQLKDVSQTSDTITIRYHYPWINPSGPFDAMSRFHVALIPLGEPAVGKIEVNIVESPGKKEHDHLIYQSSEKYVCKSFTFTIEPENIGKGIDE